MWRPVYKRAVPCPISRVTRTEGFPYVSLVASGRNGLAHTSASLARYMGLGIGPSKLLRIPTTSIEWQASGSKHMLIIGSTSAGCAARLRLIRERRFGSRVHLHPVLFSKFEKYENASKKSEKNWAETYASVEPSCKISTENTNFSALCKKDKQGINTNELPSCERTLEASSLYSVITRYWARCPGPCSERARRSCGRVCSFNS